jgi:hypothetical protein
LEIWLKFVPVLTIACAGVYAAPLDEMTVMLGQDDSNIPPQAQPARNHC